MRARRSFSQFAVLLAVILAVLALGAAPRCGSGGSDDPADDGGGGGDGVASGDVIYLSDTVLPPGTVLGGPVDTSASVPVVDTGRVLAAVDSALAAGGTRIVTSGGSYIQINGKRVTFDEDGTIRVDTVPVAGPGRGGGFVPAAEALWKPLGRWSGTGLRTTERFRVTSDEWRIIYGGTGRDDSWQRVQAVSAGRAGYIETSQRGGAGFDTTYVQRGPGIYYLTIEASGTRWTASVEEKVLPAERVTTP